MIWGDRQVPRFPWHSFENTEGAMSTFWALMCGRTWKQSPPYLPGNRRAEGVLCLPVFSALQRPRFGPGCFPETHYLWGYRNGNLNTISISLHSWHISLALDTKLLWIQWWQEQFSYELNSSCHHQCQTPLGRGCTGSETHTVMDLSMWSGHEFSHRLRDPSPWSPVN